MCFRPGLLKKVTDHKTCGHKNKCAVPTEHFCGSNIQDVQKFAYASWCKKMCISDG